MMISKSILFVVTYWISCVQCLLNGSYPNPDIPEIREGEPCVKGKIYKMSCNTCHCADNNALYCTKMACLDDESIDRLQHFKNRPFKSLRRGYDNDGPDILNLPKGKCVPGRIYRKECRLCYCDVNGKLGCGPSKRTQCNRTPKFTSALTPNDVRPSISYEDSFRLPMLPHSAAECVPGTSYMVRCNTCLCLWNGNLLCDKLYCLYEEDIHTAKAKKMSGSPCKKTDRVEETLSNRCIRCSCVKNKTQCRYLYGCVMPKRHKQHAGSKIGLSFNTKKDMCVPHSKYTLDCNTCYCEPDGGLRCTLKTCLNYQQAAHLQEQSKYLEKHGL